ncbi:MAG: TSUP family transporter [Actinomycetota bacterium]
MSRLSFRTLAPALVVGLAAGLLSGLLGVGGGIILVPLLVGVVHLSQHHAHATSLAAIVPIAAVGALTFARDDAVDLVVAGLLVLGALVGAPLGARILAGLEAGLLKTLFGLLMIAVGIQLLVA